MLATSMFVWGTISTKQSKPFQRITSIWRTIQFLFTTIDCLSSCSELVTVPEDLRAVLEQCLAEDANQENLDIYLPEVRQIITNLLQGLRAKQSIYRRIVSDHKHRSGASEGGERTSTRPRSHRTGSRTVTEEERQDAAADHELDKERKQ